MNYANWYNFIDEKLQRCDYKLYKYYSFEDEYAISNLENNLIHFSDPENFNDPFDCYMGFSVDVIMKTMFETLFLDKFQIDGPYSEQTIKAIKSIIFNEKTVEEVRPEIRIISLLLENEHVSDMFKRKCNGEEIEKQEFESVIQKAITTESFQKGIVEIIKMGLSKDDILQLKGEDKIMEILDAVSQNPQILNSLIPESNETSQIMAVFSSKEDFLDKVIRIAKLNGQNVDKIEEDIAKFRETLEIIIGEFKKKVNSIFTVTCLSKKPNNILMWSHYSNKHRGFCVEYDLRKMHSIDARLMLFPVIYSKTRPTIPVSLIGFSDTKNIKINTDPVAMKDMILTLLTKSDEWDYEEEWRIILPREKFKAEDNQCIEERIVSKVYLGANISSENEKLIRKAVGNRIPIEKLYISPEKFELITKS